jgi:hypothetical protein
MGVGGGVQIRFERALRARDEVMMECLRDTRGRSIDREILYHFDAMLLWLGGALDTTALIANRAYGLSVPDHLVGWRRNGWRSALQRVAPALHDLTERSTPLRAVIDLVAIFRNTIHGEPTSGVTFSRSGDELGLLQLPRQAERDAVAACEVLGGKEFWGFVQPGAGAIGALWDPYVLAQVVVPFAATALNALMDGTEVEKLPKSRTVASSGMPSDGFFEPGNVRRVMELHGFTAPPGHSAEGP